MVCFYKWCVFTNGVLLQIVWMSVWLCCADTLGPAYPMLVSPGQKLRADASGNHSKYSLRHVSHVSFSIRVWIIRIFSGYTHLHSHVLSGIVEPFIELTILWCTFSKQIHKKLGHVWSPNGWIVLYITCQIYWQSGIQDFRIYTYKSMISTSFHRTQVRSLPCLVPL